MTDTIRPDTMGRTQKILTTVLWACLVIAMVCVISLRALRMGAQPPVAEQPPAATPAASSELPEYYAAPSFSLTNQDGKTITDADLRGHVWVADFIFTHCAGPCPMMTAKLAQFQKRVPNAAVKMVSFSVDPERDTPDVLKDYAAKFEADPSRWHFLTGEKSAVFDVANGMKLTAKPADPENDIIHSPRFLLIDQRGQVRGAYDSADEASMEKLAADAAALAAEGKS